MWMLVHPTHLMLSSETLINENSDQKSYCWCACHNSGMYLFRNHREIKVVGGTHNVLVHYVYDCAPNLSGVVLCNPFIRDILLFILDQNLAVTSTPAK